MICGADYPDDKFDQCMNQNDNNVTLALDCLSEACAVLGVMYRCGMTSEETACVADANCQWSSSDSSCGFDMATSIPDGCAMKKQVTSQCEDSKTQESCVGECTWFAKEVECSDDGVFSEGVCESTNIFPDADKSQKAYADIEYTLKACASMATEATCLGFVAPGLAGDYRNAVASSSVGMQLGVANLAAVTLSIFHLSW